ncbi:MAG: DNA alkylation repair protein [Bacteroidetes bacterium]|nr:MAG: DNA alkylation repair protein [Bacteroidota bacterium]
MPEPLKNMYSRSFVERLANDVQRVVGTRASTFTNAVLDSNWESRELKDRGKHIAQCFHDLIPGTFAQKLNSLEQVGEAYSGFTAIVFADFVELYGQDELDVSLPYLEKFTTLCTSEFAVRPFLQRYYPEMKIAFAQWAKSDNHHVRRLASEGIRTRLPWGMKVPALFDDTLWILNHLQQLVNDDSEYVRRSVANNLNDISKDQPDLVLAFAAKQDLSNPNTSKLIKHALRGLLKQGSPEALALFGFQNSLAIKCLAMQSKVEHIAIGERLPWHYALAVKGEGALRLEYKVHYLKKNGSYSGKVFKLSETQVAGEKHIAQDKEQAFHDLTTRVHYPGTHKLELIANGASVGEFSFELTQ